MAHPKTENLKIGDKIILYRPYQLRFVQKEAMIMCKELVCNRTILTVAGKIDNISYYYYNGYKEFLYNEDKNWRKVK